MLIFLIKLFWNLPPPPASDANAGSDQELCDVNSTTLFGNAISFGTGQWTQDSGPNTAIIANQFAAETGISGLVAGTYIFTWTIQSGGCSTSDSVEIVTLDDTTVGPLNAGSDQTVAQFESIFMTASDPSPATGVWQFISGPSEPIIIDVNDPNTQITGVIPGVYEFKWTASLGVCPIKEDTVIITVVGVTDIHVAKSVDIPSPVVGSTVSYTITVSNEGINTATGVDILDQLGLGLTLVNGSVDKDGLYNAGDNSILWNDLVLVSGQSIQLHYKASVNNPTATTDEYKNTASLTNINEIDDDSTNNEDSVTLTPSVMADIVLSKTVSDSNPDEGDKIFYTITVTNNSISEVTNVVVTDNLPAGLTYINGIGTVTAWSPPNWTLGTMQPGASESLVLEVEVDPGTSGQTLTNTITNTQDQVDQNITLDDPTETIVVSSTDLVTTKTVNKTLVVEDETIWYTLTVKNNGPDLATNVTLTDLLPNGMIYVSDDSNGAYNAGTGIWTIGDLDNGKTVALKIYAKVALATQGQKIINITTAAIGDQQDPSADGDILQAEVIVDSETDVVVTKTADNTTPNEGDTVTYTITVNNNGGVAITNLVLTDVLPSGLTHVSGNTSVGTWTAPEWNVANIAPGVTEVLTLQVLVGPNTAGMSLTNTVTNQQDQFDSNTTPDDMEETVMVTSTDLVTVKSVDNTTPKEGEIITYTIAVTNNGTSDATNVNLTDNLPAQVTYVSDDGGGDYNNGSGIWTIGPLPNGDTASLQIQAEVNGGTAGTKIENTTSAATGDQTDPSLVGDDLTASVFVDNATDIVLSKTVSNGNPNEGEAIVFKIEVTNNGTIDATNLVITDVLEAGLIYVSGAASEGLWTYPNWTLTTLEAGVTETLLLQVLVASGTAGQTLTNTISNTQDQLDTNTTIDDPTESVTMTSTDLMTVKTVSNATPEEGQVISYRLEVTNNGPDTATGVFLIDQLPDGVSYLSDNRGSLYDHVTGVWIVGEIPNGASRTLNIQATVDQGTAGTTIENKAVAAKGDQADPIATGDQLSAEIHIANETDIVLSKTVDNSKPNEGDKVTYTITVANNGNINATNLTITDIFPDGLTYVSSIPSAGVYNNPNWEINLLSPGENETLVIEALVNVGTSGKALTNTISNAQDQFDNNTTPDDLDETIFVTSIDLVTEKTVNNATPSEGDEIIYTIVVRNDGPSDGTNISLIDHMPVGVTYMSDDSGGDYNEGTGIWNIGALRNGAIATLNITASVDLGTAGSTVVNTATSATGDQMDLTNKGDALEAVIYIDNQIDIAVSKVVNNASPNEGDIVTYTVAVMNHGPIAAINVEIREVLPPGLLFVSATPTTGVWNPPFWDIGSIANGASESILVQAKVAEGTAGQSITNRVQVSQDQLDTNATPDDLEETIVVASADLVTVKSVDNSSPEEGDTIQFTIQVSNQGPNDATGLSLVDILPDGITYVSDNSGSYNSGSGIWTIGSLANGASTSITIEATVDANTAGTTIINKTSAATGDQTDLTATGDVLEAAVYVNNETDIVLSKTVNNSNPNEGDVIRYTIAVSNEGSITATNIEITDILPAGLTLVSGIPSTGIWNSPIWTINAIAPGGSEILLIDARVDPGTAGQNITNTISNIQDQLDVNSSPDDLEETIVVTSSDLVTVKTVDNSVPNEGDTITYTITVANNGLSDATGISLIDNLPFGLSYVSDDSGGAYSSATGVWNIGDLANGDTASLQIVATVNNGTAGMTIVNTAIAASGDQSDPGTNGDVLSATIYIDNKTDIVLSKVANDLNPNEGDDVLFTIKVTNNGVIAATNLRIEDLLPTGLTYISAIPTTGVWTNPIWEINSLPAGATETLLLSANVDVGTAGQDLTNTISNTQDQLDTNATLDDAEETISVTALDLVTIKSVDNATPSVGTSVNYTIEVTNNGPSNATNVSIVDHLPAGVTYASDDGAGAFDNNSGIWTIGDLIRGSTVQLIIQATIDAGTAGTTITNRTIAALSDQTDITNTGDVLEAAIFIDNETDIVLSKVADNLTPNEGDNVVYTIEVENAGLIDATNVQITDVLPAGLNYVSAIPTTGNWSGSVWTISKLATGTSERILVTVVVDSGTAGQILTNTISNTQDQLDSNASLDDMEETIVVTASDLVTVKTVDNQTPEEGDTIAYTISVTNNGTSDATEVSLVDLLPSGLTYIGDDSSGMYNSGSGLWTIGNLDNGDSESITIQCTVNVGTAGTSITNNTTPASGDQADPSTNGDVLEVVIHINNETDIVLSKTVNNNNPDEGEQIEYTITVLNNGIIEATNIEITDILPAGLLYVSGTPTAGSWNAPVWKLNSLAPRASESLIVKVEVAANTAGQALTNTISNTQDQLDNDATQDDLEETISVTVADLVTIKTVDNTTPDEGEVITYSIKVTNNGTSDATNIYLTDHLPQGVVYHSDDSNGAYNFGSGIWTVGDLANGMSKTLLIEATVEVGTAGSTITNTTTSAVGDQQDPTTAGDQLQATIHIDNETDIVLTKVVNNPTPNEGDTVLYSITVSNNGTIRATNMTLTDTLPNGLIYVAGTVSAGTWAYPDWTLNELDAGATETLILQVNIASGTAGQTLINTVVNRQDQLDTNATIDDNEEQVVVSSTDLISVKSVDNSTPIVGETINYTLSVSNNGTSDATGVSLRDNLPNGVTYVSDNSGGDYNPGSGIWMIGAIANGASKELIIEATVDGGTSGSTITNTMTAAEGDEADPTVVGDVLEASIYVNNETDIVLAKHVNNNQPNEGDQVIYTITVTNNGAIDATNLIVEDLLPAGLTYVSGIPTQGLWIAPEWIVGTLTAGASETLLLRVEVAAGTSGKSYTNTISNTQDQLDTNATADDLSETIVVTAADLSVQKTVDNSSPVELGTVVYTISVTNNGPNVATGVSITDVLPPEVRYLSDDGQGSYNSGSGLWSIGAIPNGATETLNINASVRLNTVGLIIENSTSNLVADQNDLDPSNNQDSAIIVPVRDVDLSLTKEFSDQTDEASIGNQKTFEIKVTNDGQSVATGVVVSDLLPSGYQFVKYASTTGVYNSSNGIWSVGEVLPNKTVILSIDVIVLGTGDYDNCAEIIAMNEDDLDSTPGNGAANEDDYACIGISYISGLNLAVEKTILDGDLTPNVGAEITFRIELINAGKLDAYGVQVQDVVPDGYQYLTYRSTSGIYDVNTGIWTMGSVVKESSEVLLIAALVKASGAYENCATVLGSSNVDANNADDSSCITINPVSISDLELEKLVSDNTPTSGDEIEFIIRLKNMGPSPATGVQVLDKLPSGYEFVSYDTAQGSYDEFSGIWDVGTVLVGTEIDLTIRVKVLSTGEWDNTAQVQSENEIDTDSTPGNNNFDEDDQDTVEVNVNIDFFIPEEFTPNGDGLNDTFEITNLAVLYPNYRIVIVNRWGKKVFSYAHSGDPNTAPVWWDGLSDGTVNLGSDDVPDGTYFYTIEFNNNDRPPQTGWVYLRR